MRTVVTAPLPTPTVWDAPRQPPDIISVRVVVSTHTTACRQVEVEWWNDDGNRGGFEFARYWGALIYTLSSKDRKLLPDGGSRR